MGESNILELDDLGVAFGERVVLCSIRLRVLAVGCMVLLGPSGTGKSTLLRTLAGFNDANPAHRADKRSRVGHAEFQASGVQRVGKSGVRYAQPLGTDAQHAD